jgi:hypothetical protein
MTKTMTSLGFYTRTKTIYCGIQSMIRKRENRPSLTTNA